MAYASNNVSNYIKKNNYIYNYNNCREKPKNIKKEIDLKTDKQKLINHMNDLRRINIIDDLFQKLFKVGDVILIGGAIRDIVLDIKKPKDYDIIIDCSIEDLDTFMHYSYKDIITVNSLGGYKLNIKNNVFDIWSIENHWAFKEDILKCEIDNLPKSTLLNFDSLYFNMTTNKGNTDLFNESISKKCLEFTLDKEFIFINPTVEKNILKILYTSIEWNMDLSDLIIDYIINQIDKLGIDNIIDKNKKYFKYKNDIEKTHMIYKLKEILNN